MKPEEQKEILSLLDSERQTVLYPGVTRFSEKGIIRDVAGDGTSCDIMYSNCAESEIDEIIAQHIEGARRNRYELEWKLYGHDQPRCLSERLAAAGFQAGEKEAFMVLPATPEALGRFGDCTCDIRRIENKEGLHDIQRICEEVHGESHQKEIERWSATLENHPDCLSFYVAYVEAEPAACGRVYFQEGSKFAALYGGQTRERYRKRGLFTQLVAVRIREALHRNIPYVCVDALPTSEPILRKRGFQKITDTQPFCIPG